MEKIVTKARQNLKSTRDWKKCFVDLKRIHKELQIKDHVYVKVKQRKSSFKLENCAKLALRFCGPLEVLAKVGLVAYQLALPSNLKIHNVFHVFILKKYVKDISHAIDQNMIRVEPKGEFQIEPMCILDTRETILQN